MEDQDIVTEFLIESNENLSRLDQEMVQLEQCPSDAELLASVFRTFHTIKGTCGFLGFSRLERIAHQAENALSQLRAGLLPLTSELASLILGTVDLMRRHLLEIERTGREADEDGAELCRLLEEASRSAASSPGPEVASALPAGEMASGLPPNAPSITDSETATQRGAIAESAIRVDVGLLDRLMNLVGELVLARNQIQQFSAQQAGGAALAATSQRLSLITSELQEGVMKTRMQPIGVVWNKLPRLVRDVANACRKQIALEMEGADTELDKTIIEAIKDPLTHIVRNCGDHGIEAPDVRTARGKPPQGRIALRAFHEGGQVIIEISDDGNGIDPEAVKAKAVRNGLIRANQAETMGEREALNLIFVPGFSTAETVTNVSGRGVGMDVVRTNIEKIGGSVDLGSRVGEGTTVKLKIPLTLAIIPGLVVELARDAAARGAGGHGSEQFVIPQVSLVELVRLDGENARKSIERIRGSKVYRLRGNLLPIVYLREVLGLEEAFDDTGVISIAVLQAEDRQFGLVVDAVKDTQEIVVKPLGKHLKGLNCYAGATIMGDGRVALILDVLGIAQKSGELSGNRERPRIDLEAPRESAVCDKQTYLLFRAGSFERVAVPLSLVARLEEFAQSRIERAGRRLVVQYRGRILPVAALSSILDLGSPESASAQDPVQAIVFNRGADERVGLLVDQLIDIIDDAVAIRHSSGRPGLLGSAVIGKRVTDILDLGAVLDQVWRPSSEHVDESLTTTVMLAESVPFARGTMRTCLEMSGYRVVEAASASDALNRLSRTKVDVLVTALHLPGGGARQLLESIQRTPELAHIPALVVADSEAEAARSTEIVCERADEVVVRDDRERVLRSIRRLATALQQREHALCHSI